MNKKQIQKLLLIPLGIVIVGFIIYEIIKPPIQEGSTFTAMVPDVKVATNQGFTSFDLFIDFSGSMRGFIDFSNLKDGAIAKSDMTSTITAFLDKIEANFDVITQNHCGDKVYNKDDFRKKLQLMVVQFRMRR